MNISILTVFSDLYKPFVTTSLIKRASENGVIYIDVQNFFASVSPKERIDAPIFGHGPGMLIRPRVVERAIDAKQKQHGKAFKIFFSPQGRRLDQLLVREIVQKASINNHLMLIAGRYEGMDARVEEVYADMVVSLGDFVLMGGDIAALALLESFVRLIPGVVGKADSVEEESFSGPFVEYPQYTEPVVWRGLEVPEIVRSGNHGALDGWRQEQAVRKTVKHHFQWLRSFPLSEAESSIAARYIPPHYAALLHNDVLISDEKKQGTTSVTSIDIHDIARSCRTYGVTNFFIVTHLHDQQKIVQRLLDFWMTEGIEYNVQRHEAIRQVVLKNTLDDVIEIIERFEGKRPLVLATSAREVEHRQVISSNDQERVWSLGRPVLFVFGTGRGLTEERICAADYLMKPIRSFFPYNHLSVRSAVAIVLDRWLGIHERSFVVDK